MVKNSSISNNSVLHLSTHLSSILLIDRTLSGATTPDQSGPGRDGNEGVLRIPQSSSITGTSPSDCLVSYPGHSLGEHYPFAEGAVGVFYSHSRLSNDRSLLINLLTPVLQLVKKLYGCCTNRIVNKIIVGVDLLFVLPWFFYFRSICDFHKIALEQKSMFELNLRNKRLLLDIRMKDWLIVFNGRLTCLEVKESLKCWFIFKFIHNFLRVFSTRLYLKYFYNK